MDADTVLGGQAAAFPSTLWTNILHAGDKDGETRRIAWESLAHRYWRPVYGYIRIKWAKSNEDAKDLTQEFFAWMMETGLPQRADPGRGRFRVFIKKALENYLRMEVRDRKRQKRGGNRSILKFEDGSGAGAFEIADQSGKTPEQVLEDAWRQDLLARGTNLLKESYRRKGKDLYFELFRDFYLGEQAKVSHEELAAKNGITVTDVNNHLMDAKRAFREILKDLLSETVERTQDLHEEFKELFGKGAP